MEIKKNQNQQKKNFIASAAAIYRTQFVISIFLPSQTTKDLKYDEENDSLLESFLFVIVENGKTNFCRHYFFLSAVG